MVWPSRPSAWGEWLVCPALAVMAQWSLPFGSPRGDGRCLGVHDSPLLAWTPLLWRTEEGEEDQIPFIVWIMLRPRLLGAVVMLLMVSIYMLILLLICYMCMPKALEEAMRQCALSFFQWTYIPAYRLLCWRRTHELVAYSVVLSLSAQSCRYSIDKADVAHSVAVCAAIASVIAWAYSARLHSAACGDSALWLLVSGLFCGCCLLPLSYAHRSQALSMAAALSLQGSLAAAVALVGRKRQWWQGRSPKVQASFVSVICTCFAAASGMLFPGLLLVQRTTSRTAPWSLLVGSALCTVRLGFSAALLVASSKLAVGPQSYIGMQVATFFMLGGIFTLGFMLGAQGKMLIETGHVVLVIWLAIKGLELPIDFWPLRLVWAYLIAQFISKEQAWSMINPGAVHG